MTSRECRDISPQEANSYILGYTVGNDLSCRKFQLPGNSGGQFFFAKAFDKFAPIGPTLISPEIFGRDSKFTVVTKVNGEVRQTADLGTDMIFSPEKILSHMSQGKTETLQQCIFLVLCCKTDGVMLGTTIPAGTAVMTGTPAGVGAFRSPKVFLQHGDVVEVEMNKVGTLRNEIHFQ